MNERKVNAFESNIMRLQNVTTEEPIFIRGRIEASQKGHGTPNPLDNIRTFNGYKTIDINFAEEAYKCIPKGQEKSWQQNGITVEHMGDGRYCIYGTATTQVEISIPIDPFVIPAGSDRLLEMKNTTANPHVYLYFYYDDKRMDFWKIYPIDRKDIYIQGTGKKVNRFTVNMPSGCIVDCELEPIFSKGKQTKSIKLPAILGDIYDCEFEIGRDGNGTIVISKDVANVPFMHYIDMPGYQGPIISQLPYFDQNGNILGYYGWCEVGYFEIYTKTKYLADSKGALLSSCFECGIDYPNRYDLNTQSTEDDIFGSYPAGIGKEIARRTSLGVTHDWFRVQNKPGLDIYNGQPGFSLQDLVIQVLYKIEQPVAASIITDPIYALEGSNAIWLDCGKILNVEYPEYVEDQSGMMNVGMYEKLVSGENQKPRFMQFLRLILHQTVDAEMFLKRFLQTFNLNYAEGAQLDAIGAIVGVSRHLPILIAGSDGVLNDIDYRMLIRAKIARAHWDGTNEGLFEIMNTVFNGFGVTVTEYETADATDVNMAVKYTIRGILTNVQKAMIEANLLMPVPMGVHATYTFMTTITDTNITAVTGLNEMGNTGVAEAAAQET